MKTLIDNFIKGKANFYLFDISHVSKPTGVWADRVSMDYAFLLSTSANHQSAPFY